MCLLNLFHLFLSHFHFSFYTWVIYIKLAGSMMLLKIFMLLLSENTQVPEKLQALSYVC